MNLKKLLAACYLASLLVWLAHGAGVLVQTAWYAREGLAGQRQLAFEELDPVAVKPYENEQDPNGIWYVSTDSDPRLYWEHSAWVRRVVLRIEHQKPGCGVELYYKLPGQSDYSTRQVAYAERDADGNFVFDLGGLLVSGLRIDPDSVGGVLTRFDGLTLNPPQSWFSVFVPGAGQWLLLLGLPLAAAALVAEVGSLLGLPRQKRIKY